MRRSVRLGALLAVGALTLPLTLTACSNDDSGNGGEEARDQSDVKVVASTTQICDYVTQIATDESEDAKLSFELTDSEGNHSHHGAEGDGAEATLDLTCLLAPNASAHEHEMTPDQMKALSDADLFLVSGVDLEHFLDSAVESSGFAGTLGVTSGVLTAAEVEDQDATKAESDQPYTVDRGEEKVDVKPWPFPADEPGEDPEFQYDPHIWTSPAQAATQVRNIGHFLEQVSPEHKDLFADRVKEYSEQLEDLDGWVKDSLDSVPAEHRVLFTSHDAFGYFSNEFGVKFIGAAMSDFNSQQDATADHIQQAAQEVKDSGAVALFAENSNNSRSIEAIARAAGVKAIIGDDALYGDSLGPAGSEGDTYVKSIIHNVTTLVDAWDGHAAQLPASLS